MEMKYVTSISQALERLSSLKSYCPYIESNT